jgi:hypothetical protein
MLPSLSTPRVLLTTCLVFAACSGSDAPAADTIAADAALEARADATGDSAARDTTSGDLQSPGPCTLGGTPPAGYTPGVTTYGDNKLIVYVPGELPIVIGSPHGGKLEGGLPERDKTTAEACPGSESVILSNDSNSQELARAIADAIQAKTGRFAHLVINDLKRSRLDANRSRCVAAAGNAIAGKAWDQFHGFIDDAKATVEARCGRGLYLDIHTHGHDTIWVELGVLLSATTLAKSDAFLDGDPSYAQASSLRGLAAVSPQPFSTLLRGPQSFGALLSKAAQGLACVPSPQLPDPDGKSYFSGGFNTALHGSRAGGAIDAIQIETRFSIFDSVSERQAYAAAVAEAALQFLRAHYGYTF